MNEDIYAEWLIKCKDPAYKVPAIIGYVILAIASVVVMIKFTSWGFIAPVVVLLLIFWTCRYFKLEYEYVFVTNELTIDRIYSQSSRKTVLKIEMSSVESVEPTNEQQNKMARENKSLKYEDFSSHLVEASKTYTIRYSADGAAHLLVFEPNEKILKAMWRCSPSKVKIAK